MFLVFLPGRSGVNNIIGKAAAIEARKNDAAAEAIANAGADAGNDGDSARLAKKLNSIAAKKGRFVVGAISDPTALPNYVAPKKGEKKPPAKKGAIKTAAAGDLVARRTGNPGGDGARRSGANSLRQSAA